jgi:hypothetical protein
VSPRWVVPSFREVLAWSLAAPRRTKVHSFTTSNIHPPNPSQHSRPDLRPPSTIRQAHSTISQQSHNACAKLACIAPPRARPPTTPQRPPASERCTPTHTAMLNLRSALVAATLAVSALAVPQITVPAAGATIPVTAAGTQISVEWKDDGEAPKISTLKSFQLQLIVGGNTAEDSVGWNARLRSARSTGLWRTQR